MSGFKNWSAANVLNMLVKPQRHKAVHCAVCLLLPKECENKYYCSYDVAECRLNYIDTTNRDLKSY